MAPNDHTLRRFFKLFNEPTWKWALIFVGFVATALLDVVGIGAIGLFVSLVMEPDKPLPGFLNFGLLASPDSRSRIAVVGAIALGVFAARLLLQSSIQIALAWFFGSKMRQIQKHLFEYYLFSPLLFRKASNASSFLYHLNLLPSKFSVFANDFFSLLANGILAALITSFLASTNLIATVVIALLFSLATALYVYLIRDRAQFYAKLSADAAKAQFKTIQESMGALDEIQILGKQPFFFQRFSEHLRVTFVYSIRMRILGMIPRPLAELILIVFIIAFTIFYAWFVGDITAASATIGMFVLAGLRLVPAASSISANIKGLRSSAFAIHQLTEELERINAASHHRLDQRADSVTPLTLQSGISFNNVSFAYPNTSKTALTNFSMSIQKGSRTAIIGPSGSGKSTLINILIGNFPPSSGDILIDGKPLQSQLHPWRAALFYLPQSLCLLDDSIARNIALGVPDDQIDKQALNDAIAAAQLTDFVNSLPKGIRTEIGDRGDRISGGQRQRIGLARALYFKRSVLVMDEATSALDEQTEKMVKESLLNLGQSITVIMVTHNLRSEDIFDQVIHLNPS